MTENKNIPPFECNMYSIGFKKGRKVATDDIVEAIDDFLKYDYPEELNDGFIRGMKKAREIVKDWGCENGREQNG